MSQSFGNNLESIEKPDFKIGVVVLSYNQEDILQTCLDSILSQKLIDTEIKIYVIDDASTDSTKDVILSYSKIYPDLVIPILYEVNQYQNGFSPEFPVIESIDASHVAFCDGDDYWIDDYKLEKQIQIFKKDYSTAIVHTDYFMGKMANDAMNHLRRSQKETDKAQKIKRSSDLIQGNDIKKSTALFRKSAIDFNFLKKSFGIRAQDWLVAISAGSNGGIRYIDEQTTCYRVSSDASFQSLGQKERLEIKDEVRWFCAANLPESKLRNEFRKFLMLQYIRSLISSNSIYRKIRPLVGLYRQIKSRTKRTFGK